MKTGKEIKIDDFDNYKIVFGSVNNKHPKTIYINISAWAEPSTDDEETNYTRVIKDFHKKIKQNLFNFFDTYPELTKDFVKEKTIVDLDIRESGIKFGKKSFINCEVTLFLNTEVNITSIKTRLILTKFTSELVEKNFEENSHFLFTKTKI